MINKKYFENRKFLRDLQKTNTSISNLLSAIEKGIFTTTTKQRLEELEE